MVSSRPPARRIAACSFALTALLCPVVASAQNLRDVPLGGRTAVMGGAGVAAGIDAAMPYLNPAGIAGTPYDILSLSANVYSGLGATVNGYYAPNGLDASYGDVTVREDSVGQRQLAVLPSTVTYFKRFGRGKRFVAALSVLSPSYSQIDVDGRFRAEGPTRLLTSDLLGEERFRQIFAGPTIAVRHERHYRLGVSLFASYADLKTDEQRLSLVSTQRAGGGQTLATTNERTLTSVTAVGMTAVLGAQLRIVKGLWLGAAFESPGLSLYGTGSTSTHSDSSTADEATGDQTVSRTNREGKIRKAAISRPLRVSGGIAYEKPKAFALAADLHFSPGGASFRSWQIESENLQVTSGGDLVRSNTVQDFRRGTRTTTNWSVGAEAYVSKTIALRGGVMSDYDVSEDRTQGEDRKNGRVDWTVFSAGFGHTVGLLGTSYGLAYRHGRGVAYARDLFGSDPSRTAEVPFTAHGVMLMLSGVVRADDDERDAKKDADAQPDEDEQ